MQGSWVTQGPKIGQVSLSFGADDLGSIMIEENVVYAAGARNRMTQDEMRRLISDAGYAPGPAAHALRRLPGPLLRGADPGAQGRAPASPSVGRRPRLRASPRPRAKEGGHKGRPYDRSPLHPHFRGTLSSARGANSLPTEGREEVRAAGAGAERGVRCAVEPTGEPRTGAP